MGMTVRQLAAHRARLTRRLRAIGPDVRCACDRCGEMGDAWWAPGGGYWAYCAPCASRTGLAEELLRGGFVVEPVNGGAR